MSEGHDRGRGRTSAEDTGRSQVEELATQLGHLARALEHEDSLDDTLNAIVHASVGTVPGGQQQDQLRHAISTRDIIGQAKGIVMERYKMTGDEAFRLLVRLSQTTHRKLYDIAQELTTGAASPASLAGGARGAN